MSNHPAHRHRRTRPVEMAPAPSPDVDAVAADLAAYAARLDALPPEELDAFLAGVNRTGAAALFASPPAPLADERDPIEVMTMSKLIPQPTSAVADMATGITHALQPGRLGLSMARCGAEVTPGPDQVLVAGVGADCRECAMATLAAEGAIEAIASKPVVSTSHAADLRGMGAGWLLAAAVLEGRLI